MESERKAPGHWSRDVGEAIGDPIAEGETGNVQDQFNDNELASPGRFGGLGLPYRSSGCVHSVTQAGNDPADIHLRNPIGCDLQDGTNGHNGGAK